MIATVVIPLWCWPALCVVCLIALGEYDAWRINRRRDFLRDIEAERIARENAQPLGNSDVLYDWKRDVA